MGDSDEEIPNEIMALSPPRYRRPNHRLADAKPNTYYRVGVLEEIKDVLNAVGRENLVHRFINGPFGHFLYWSPGCISSGAMHGILSRAIFSTRGIWFHFRGQDIEYTIRDHALVTGLRFGNSNFDCTMPVDPTTSQLYRIICNDFNDPPTSGQLIDVFKSLRSRIDDVDGRMHLQLAQVLVADIFILGHDSQRPPFPWLWVMVENDDVWQNFPWGAYSYKTLRYYVQKAQDNARKYHFYGPAWALVTWAFEIIEGLGNAAGIYSPNLYPRCLRWAFRKKLRLEGGESLIDLFEGEGYEIANIELEEGEDRQPYWISLHYGMPMEVQFVIPTNPLTVGEQFPAQQRLRRSRRPPQATSSDVGGPRRDAAASRRLESSPDEAGTSRPHRRSRDTGKRTRSQAIQTSSSSSGAQGASEDVVTPSFVRKEIAKAEKRIVKGFRADLAAFETRMKKLIQNAVEVMQCGGSRSARDVSEPRRRSPPITSSARESDVRATHVHSDDIPQEQPRGYVGEVGGRRDTTLPIYTASTSTPFTGFEGNDQVSQAYTQIFGQTMGLSTGHFHTPSSSTLHQTTGVSTSQLFDNLSANLFGQTMGFSSGQFQTPSSTTFLEPRFSMPEIGMSRAPFVTQRDPQRFSTSNMGESSSRMPVCSLPLAIGSDDSEDILATNIPHIQVETTYIPKSEPTPLKAGDLNAFSNFMKLGPTKRVRIREAFEDTTVSEFRQFIGGKADWSVQMMDLYMLAMRQRLWKNEEVYPEQTNGRTAICNCNFMAEIDIEHERLRNLNQELVMGNHEEYRTMLREKFTPSVEMCATVQGRGNLYVTQSWFTATTIILPHCVQGQFFVLRIEMLRSTIHLHCPHYSKLDDEGKGLIRKSVTVLKDFLPTLLQLSFYWRYSSIGLNVNTFPEFRVIVQPSKSLFKPLVSNNSGTYAAMTVEQLISGCPDLAWGSKKKNVSAYRELCAGRIYMLRL